MLRRYPSLSEGILYMNGLGVNALSYYYYYYHHHHQQQQQKRRWFSTSQPGLSCANVRLFLSSTPPCIHTSSFGSLCYYPSRHYATSPIEKHVSSDLEKKESASSSASSPPSSSPSRTSYSPHPATRLHVVHPDLLDEWVPEMNEEDIQCLTSSSQQAVVWRCKWCQHLYSCSPSRRVQLRGLSCPKCHGRGNPAAAASTSSDSSSALFSDGRDKGRGVSSLEERNAKVREEKSDEGLSSSWKIPSSSSSFGTAFPHLLPYWDEEANGSLSPYQVPADSCMSIWWKCPVELCSASTAFPFSGMKNTKQDDYGTPLPHQQQQHKVHDSRSSRRNKSREKNTHMVRMEYFSRPLSAFVANPYPPLVQQSAKALLEENLLHQIQQALRQHKRHQPATASAPAAAAGKEENEKKEEGKERSLRREVSRRLFLEDWKTMMCNMKGEVHEWYQQHHVDRRVEDDEGKEENKDGSLATAWREGGEEDGEGRILAEGCRGGGGGWSGHCSRTSPSAGKTEGEMKNGQGDANERERSEALRRRGGNVGWKEKKKSSSSSQPHSFFIPISVLTSEVGPHCQQHFLFGVSTRRVLPFLLTPPLQKASHSSSSIFPFGKESSLKIQEKFYLQQQARMLALGIFMHTTRCRYQLLEPRFSDWDLSCLLPPAVLTFHHQDTTWTSFFSPTKEQARRLYEQLQSQQRVACLQHSTSMICAPTTTSSSMEAVAVGEGSRTPDMKETEKKEGEDNVVATISHSGEVTMEEHEQKQKGMGEGSRTRRSDVLDDEKSVQDGQEQRQPMPPSSEPSFLSSSFSMRAELVYGSAGNVPGRSSRRTGAVGDEEEEMMFPAASVRVPPIRMPSPPASTTVTPVLYPSHGMLSPLEDHVSTTSTPLTTNEGSESPEEGGEERRDRGTVREIEVRAASATRMEEEKFLSSSSGIGSSSTASLVQRVIRGRDKPAAVSHQHPRRVAAGNRGGCPPMGTMEDDPGAATPSLGLDADRGENDDRRGKNTTVVEEDMWRISSADEIMDREYQTELHAARWGRKKRETDEHRPSATTTRRSSRSSSSSSMEEEEDDDDGGEGKESGRRWRSSVPRDTPESLLDVYHRPSPTSPSTSSTGDRDRARYSSRSFRLRLPRGNPSGMIQYGNGDRSAVQKTSSPTSSAAAAGDLANRAAGSATDRMLSSPLSLAPRGPRKVGRPKRSSTSTSSSPSTEEKKEE